LLSWAWIAFTIEADNAVEAASSGDAGRVVRISMPMWANGLRFIDGDGITVGELQARARARCNIGGLERWGWITVGDAGAGRRDGYGTHRGVRNDTVLRTTRAGAGALRRWPLAVADSLQQALLPLAGQLPAAPPEVNPSDGFRTHVLPGPETEQDASLGALLGQALTALTLEHEQGSKVSRPAAANILRVIDDQVVRLRDLPPRSGVSREAAAMAVSYLVRKRLAEPRPERSVVLTAAGRDALGDYRARADHRASPALRACLEAVVAQRGALAEGLIPPDGGWRGQPPYLAQTRRLLADPAAALPWHPMVLHRGGWPDGS
jgi:hypothetical protein